VLEALASLASASLRYLPTLVLLWLAFFFGRTLRKGEVSLIERIARVANPALPPALCRYTHGLTALWSVYFAVAALLTVVANLGFHAASVGVASVSAAFFVGEYWLRRLVLFPDEPFPGLVQQVRNTLYVWRPLTK
jgi:uncharacterized membrane protein